MVGMVDKKTREDIRENEKEQKQKEQKQKEQKQKEQAQAEAEAAAFDPTQVTKRERLMEHSPQEVETLYDRGEIDRSQTEEYIARKSLTENGLLGMNPEDVEYGYKHGVVSKNEAEAYADKAENPWWFYTKEAASVGIGAVAKAGENTLELAGDMANTLLPIQTLIPGQDFSTGQAVDAMKKQASQAFPETAEVAEDMTTNYTTAGKVAQPFAQFLIPYAGLGKASSALKSGQIASKMLARPTMKSLSKTKPKTAKFISRITEDTVKGSIVDYSVWDPYETGVFDVLDENTDIPVVDFLKTDPDNPAALERLRNAAEGSLMGVALDGLMTGLKATKGAIWKKNMGDADAVIDEVNAKAREKGLDPTSTPVKETEEEIHKLVKDANDSGDLEGAPSQSSTEASKLDESETPSQNTAEEPEAPKTDAEGAKSEADADDVTQPKEDGQVHADQDGYVKRTMGQTEEDLSTTTRKMMDDIAAGADPEDLPEDKALAMMQFEGSQEVLLKLIRAHGGDTIEEARGAPKPQSKTESQAVRKLSKLTGQGVGRTMDAMRSTFGNVQNLDVQVQTLNHFLTTYSSAISKKLDMLDQLSLDDEMLLAEHINNLQELTDVFYGVRAEIGRALNAYKMPYVNKHSKWDMDAIPDEVKQDIATGSTRNEVRKSLRKFKDAKNTQTKMKIARSLNRNGFMKGLLEMVQANLLWNPATHAGNFIGGTLAHMNNAGKRSIALGVEAATSKDMRYLQELKAYHYGSLAGVMDSFRIPGVTKASFKNPKQFLSDATAGIKDVESESGKVWKALFSGDPQLDSMAKFEGQTTSALDSLNVNLGKGWKLPIGTLFKLPFHGLTAGDEMVKHMGYFAELHSQAYRSGIDRGLHGEGLKKYVKQLTSKSPPKELHRQALANARDITMTENLGQTAQGFEKFMNAGGGVGKILAMPFYKVVVNLTKFAARNSPLGVASKKVRDQITAGGIERTEAIAGIAQGTAVMAGAWGLYQSGMITGRIPTELRDTYRNLGIPEYSFKVGDKWVSYQRSDPMGYLIGTAADMALFKDMWDAYDPDNLDQEMEDRFEKLATAGILTVAEPILGKTMMEGMSELMDVIMTPERKDVGSYLIKDQLTKLVPGTTGLDALQRQMDDTQRMTESAGDLLVSKIKRSALPARRHAIFGTPLEEHEAWPMPHLGLFKTQKQRKDKVTEEFMRLGANVPGPSENITVNGVDVKLEPEQYAQLNKYIAELNLEEKLAEVIEHPQYKQSRNAKQKSKVLKNVISRARREARRKLLENDSELQQTLKERGFKAQQATEGILDLSSPLADALRILEDND